MPHTIAEKILGAHAGHDVSAGDIVVAAVDFTMGQDGTSMMVIDELEHLGAARVFDPERFAMVLDHSAPSPVAGTSRIHAKMRSAADKYGSLLYDIGEGICHQLLPERGHVVPGDLIVGADSHTCTYGALNAAATGVGSTDLAAAAYTGKLWFKVPESMRVSCRGKLGEGVYSKDLVLHLVGDIGADGATYCSVEFVGEAISALSVDARFTVCNMAVEMGAKFGIMEADQKVLEWIAGRSAKSPRPTAGDEGAHYAEVREYDVSDLGPQVAKPHAVDNVAPVEEVEGTPIQQGVIGTCTNGRVEDFEAAAQVLAGRRVDPHARLICVPSSKAVLIEIIERGIHRALLDAGAVFVTPGCGPCVGTHAGVPSDCENVISTANRNFVGRMGNPEGVNIYLGSPATVAASVIEGRIVDPRKHL
ncbi:MAG: 3-isopropylmalate dehydratase large subunit [Armatimonadota bacterium]|nr:MAG: 3-isopropylmalate dehydratase large subunit [Armatimonadota bacterium]